MQQGDVAPFALQGADHGCDRRRLSRTPRAPEQDIMRRMTRRMTPAIFQQRGFLRVDASQQLIIHRREGLHRADGAAVPQIGGRAGKVRRTGGGRRQSFQRFGDAGEECVGHGAGLATGRHGGKSGTTVILLS